MILAASLPPLYDAWVEELLAAPIPAETNATCDSCAMVVTESMAGDPGYNPATKCCTFLPHLWNFLVGGILLDHDAGAAKGRATVEARLDSGVAVTPLGLGRTATYRLLYTSSGPSKFGQSRSMRCSHYLHEEGGLCGVWRHRESTCATWFCKYVRGAVGQEFWEQLHQLLQAAEQSLAGWALFELGMDRNALARLFRPRRDPRSFMAPARDTDRAPDPTELRAVWGSWFGRERELYQECARLVAPLVWADVLRIGGNQLSIYAGLVQDAYSRLMDESPPERPVMALVQITPRGHGRARLATYSQSDALEVPAVVGAIIPYFDGRPMAEALENIRRGEGLNVDPSLVRKLADFGVLQEQAAPITR